ncbi:hypothetical protein PCANC_17583 [Puccinia coronata f. sp. avenae]|uniref:Uncharacterized protein n=1 Tax=Puccinia coronata f. sp. avenae TaxID=200324 RepID=A0A2N5VMW7_9BASI|nr:hypothetical protein PCANC_17583 [Puccinia coronata f. sp. avenae]
MGTAAPRKRASPQNTDRSLQHCFLEEINSGNILFCGSQPVHLAHGKDDTITRPSAQKKQESDWTYQAAGSGA